MRNNIAEKNSKKTDESGKATPVSKTSKQNSLNNPSKSFIFNKDNSSERSANFNSPYGDTKHLKHSASCDQEVLEFVTENTKVERGKKIIDKKKELEDLKNHNDKLKTERTEMNHC